MTAAIIIMAKAPVVGQVKTRLTPHLSAEAAANCYRLLLVNALTAAYGAGLDEVILACSPDAFHPFFTESAHAYEVTLVPQGEGNLGERMERLFQIALERHTEVVMIGGDCIDLTTDDLLNAYAALANGVPCVFYTASDGGYVLVGARERLPAIFASVSWSTDQVMSQTRAHLKASNTAWLELGERHDIDTHHDFLTRFKPSRLWPMWERIHGAAS